MKKTVVYVVILVALSLGAGVVLGMGIGRKTGYARHLAFGKRFGQPGMEGRYPEGLRRHAPDVLKHKLNLSEEQAGKIKDILDASRAKVEASQKEALKNFAAIRESTNAKIKEVLTPKQQVEFDRLTFKRKQREGLRRPSGHLQPPAEDQPGPGREEGPHGFPEDSGL